MKCFLFMTILLIGSYFSSSAQDVTSISTLRMGPFKLGSKVAEVETVVGSKIKLKPIKDDAWEYDTVLVTYNTANYRLVFSIEQDQNNNKYKKLNSIYSANTALKTKSSIGIGNNKAQILLAYDKYNLSIYNDWQYLDKNNPKDKIQFINLNDVDAGTVIRFTTVDRTVTGIELSYMEEGD